MKEALHKKCNFCNNEFVTNNVQTLYCSSLCRNRMSSSKKKKFNKTNCVDCGVEIIKLGNSRRCKKCSIENKKKLNSLEYRKQHTNFENKKKHDKEYYCKNFDKIKLKSNEYYRNVAKDRLKYSLIKTTCAICGNEFEIRKYSQKRSSNHLCSKECTSKFNSERFKGEKSPMWKGGITPLHNVVRKSVENRNWINEVFKRDKYTCQKCGKSKCKVSAHHIINFSKLYQDKHELLTDINNGITLCTECHKKFHKRYGKADNDENQIKEFLQ